MATERYEFKGALEFCKQVFTKFSYTEEEAGIIAEAILTSDLFGIMTHGILLLSSYEEAMEHGRIDPKARPEILQETPVSALMEGHSAMGHLTAYRAMELAIKKAKESGIGVVSVRNSNHYGFAGFYPLMAIKQNMIGFSTTNTEGIMVPTNGKRALLGTNPLAFGMPAHPFPLLLDVATTIIPSSKLTMHTVSKTPLQEGWAIDSTGNPSTDAAEVRRCLSEKISGGLLPFGGHKGYGISLMLEALTGILAGGFTSDMVRYDPWKDQMCHLFVAMDYGMFGDKSAIELRLSSYLEMIRTSERANPDVPILTHGEKEFRTMKENQQKGIAILDTTYADLKELAKRMEISLSDFLIPVK